MRAADGLFWALLPLPLGEGWGEGRRQSTPRDVVRHRALTLTLSQRERGQDPRPGEAKARVHAQRQIEQGARQ